MQYDGVLNKNYCETSSDQRSKYNVHCSSHQKVICLSLFAPTEVVEHVWWTGSPQPNKTHLSLLAKFLANPVVDDSWHGYPRASHTIGAKNYNCKLDIHLHLAMLFQSRLKSMDSVSKHVDCECFHETSMSQIYRILNISSCWKIPKLLTKSKINPKKLQQHVFFGRIRGDSMGFSYTRLDEQLDSTVLQDTWQVVHWPTPRWAYLRAGKKSSYVTSWGEICQSRTNMLDSHRFSKSTGAKIISSTI